MENNNLPGSNLNDGTSSNSGTPNNDNELRNAIIAMSKKIDALENMNKALLAKQTEVKPDEATQKPTTQTASPVYNPLDIANSITEILNQKDLKKEKEDALIESIESLALKNNWNNEVLNAKLSQASKEGQLKDEDELLNAFIDKPVLLQKILTSTVIDIEPNLKGNTSGNIGIVQPREIENYKNIVNNKYLNTKW